MPLTVTETPCNCMGSGTPGAVSAAGASCAPVMLNCMPGAKDCCEEAAFARPEMAGAPALDASVTVTDPAAVRYWLSPPYCTVTVLLPGESWEPSTVTLAVALP